MNKTNFILSKDNVSNYKKNYEIIAHDNNIADIVYKYIDKYGYGVDLNCIDVSEVTDMSDVFSNQGFEGDVSEWDVSNVVKMDGMFAGCRKFNCNLSNWDVRNVKSMENMFQNCRVFNQPLENWDVSSVENMEDMFRGCHRFNQDLSKWDVRNVKDMNSMFINCLDFEGKGLKKWNVENVKDISNMFKFCYHFKEDLSKWKLNSCKDSIGFDVGTKSWEKNKKPFIKII